MRYEATIGLEIHAHLRTATKLFCGCPTSQTEQPNTHICPVCLGYPGVLPQLNREAVRLAIVTAQSLGMDITRRLRWGPKALLLP